MAVAQISATAFFIDFRRDFIAEIEAGKAQESAEEAKTWLNLFYLIECGRDICLRRIEGQIRKVESIKVTERVMVVIDDCQHLGNIDHKLSDGVALVVDKLQRATVTLQISILAVCPDLREDHSLPRSGAIKCSARTDLSHGDRPGTEQKTHRTQSSAHTPHHKEPLRGQGQTGLRIRPGFFKVHRGRSSLKQPRR